jgi:hypothetical protein
MRRDDEPREVRQVMSPIETPFLLLILFTQIAPTTR